ncbi:GNAT family N-acetyltransferase [Streptomyces meridianus]|uniref:GNAT family N-acetyltransferase n=1 Tax=Streptomyces meridianus TaxID=2938945 RepID=A0ABT0XC19_9ACTN|nr:GNAT family N-acetyltransferase [Streptomyces meridianus]MCM2580061.1 GNAT family N-acetyltransferase [Streptomyces meridianus]
MDLTVRPVRADEWRQVRDLRLTALRDPTAPIAFLETYEAAAAESDAFWQDRASRSAEGDSARQFVAEDTDGVWQGTVTALVERPGTVSPLGNRVELLQTHLVGVFVRPDGRGTGLAHRLFEAALAWSWSLPVERARLYVHGENARAQAMYRSAGFSRTGRCIPCTSPYGGREWEMAISRPAVR